jgi:hypothetical protein
MYSTSIHLRTRLEQQNKVIQKRRGKGKGKERKARGGKKKREGVNPLPLGHHFYRTLRAAGITIRRPSLVTHRWPPAIYRLFYPPGGRGLDEIRHGNHPSPERSIGPDGFIPITKLHQHPPAGA